MPSVKSSREIAAQICEDMATSCDGSVIQCEYPGDDMEPDYDTAEHYRKRAKILRVAARILLGKVVWLDETEIENQPKS